MRLFFSSVALLVVTSAFAQGTLIFNNRTPSGDAPISIGDGRGLGVIPAAKAQLVLVSDGGVLTPLTPITTFRTSSAAAMHFINEVNPFVIDGILPGEPATVRLRAFVGESYEAARNTPGGIWGESNDVFIPQLGPTPGVHSAYETPGLNGLRGFQILAVPEPSSIALGLMAVAVACAFRRR